MIVDSPDTRRENDCSDESKHQDLMFTGLSHGERGTRSSDFI